MIEFPSEFDDIRPYYDREIAEAMSRIASDPLLERVVRYLGLENDFMKIRETLLGLDTIDRFQHEIMLPLCRRVIATTVGNFTCNGIENITSPSSRVYVSNHRDIVMDSVFHQIALDDNSVPTSHITFGSNLMNPQFVVDVGLSNKMFRTERKCVDAFRFMEISRHLSGYIRYAVTSGESVWIAQRNGRTKDGNDVTEPGLMKMLLYGTRDRKSLMALGITPVSISYQWEPCDILKTVELCRSFGGTPYVKAPGEDLNSIVTGITSYKGNVHLSICPSLEEDHFSGEHVSRSDILNAARIVDSRIYDGYRLWDTNFIAMDILERDTRYSDRYDRSVREMFECRIKKAVEEYPSLDRELFERIFLGIYANPVRNCCRG